METRFGTMVRIAKFIAAIGWLVAVVGLVVTVSPFFLGKELEHKIGPAMAGTIIFLAFSVGPVLVAVGLLLVAAGQAVQCFAAIEENTRRHGDLIEKLFFTMKDRLPRASATGEARNEGGADDGVGSQVEKLKW